MPHAIEETARRDADSGDHGCCRRDFLKTSGVAVAAISIGVGCSRQVNRGTFPVGEAAGIAPGSSRLVADGPFVIARDEGGFYAMSGLCTHLGCRLEIEGERLTCPCHGSAFDINGQVTEGPARSALEHFRVSVEGGSVTVDTSQVVPATTRAQAAG